MSDIRKKTGKKGVTYQVRYADSGSITGYSYKTFETLKEARAFRESPKQSSAKPHSLTIPQAVLLWLDVCEKEGRDGRPPVTRATHKYYRYVAEIMKAYAWPTDLRGLTKPHVVAFRSWLIKEHGRYLAAKTLTYFHGVLSEMATRGEVDINAASNVSVRKETRYDEPVAIPTEAEIAALLQAADDLANSTNLRVAKTWKRYRPMLYLAVDSGMRPQEYVAVAASSFFDGGVTIERAVDKSGDLTVPKTLAARRFIELSDVTIEMVRQYVATIDQPNIHNLAFPTATGHWQSQDNWRKRCFDEVCRKAGLVEVSVEEGKEVVRSRYAPYALRHYFASVLIAQGTDLAKVKTLMGHTDISTTFDVYAHLIRRAEDKKSRRQGMISTMKRAPSELLDSLV
ncbi:site-specific integrase [Variovorax sp. H27-G14]|uniref:tyrosine-type recombinase/integrase n=1 Tax=Variovorax sp. H27-G14 TaxID=3111914 RepID=UPI0038FC739A